MLLWDAERFNAEPHVVVGLAAYAKSASRVFRRLIGSLRTTGYLGNIILGVHNESNAADLAYLKAMNVTAYAVPFVACAPGTLAYKPSATSSLVRSKCAAGMVDLPLEAARFALAARWLEACAGCTGWSLVLDTRDVLFQAHPFAQLDPRLKGGVLLLVEEAHPNTSVFVETSATKSQSSRRSV